MAGLPLGFPDDPFATAAARTRQSVKPEGGRQEGLGTFLAQNFPAHVLKGLLSLPQRATQAAGELQRQGDVYDPAPAVETALMMAGAPGVPAGAVGSSVGKGIRAYHGSPHDFERFDLSKIGTGEGAQAYGHGLYFAENPKTAQSYRDALAAKNNTLTNRAILDKFGGDAKKAAEYLRGLAPEGSPLAKHYEDVAQKLEAGAPLSGRMYEVNINAHPEQMLPWDQPLPMGHPARAAALDAIPQSRFYTSEPEATLRGTSRDMIANVPELSGERLYSALGRRLGSEPAASDVLKEAGIPGIKYLDQGSRSTGAGTNNYVMFDDKLIDILRKYGLAGIAPAAGAAASNDAPLPLAMPQSQ